MRRLRKLWFFSSVVFSAIFLISIWILGWALDRWIGRDTLTADVGAVVGGLCLTAICGIWMDLAKALNRIDTIEAYLREKMKDETWGISEIPRYITDGIFAGRITKGMTVEEIKNVICEIAGEDEELLLKLRWQARKDKDAPEVKLSSDEVKNRLKERFSFYDWPLEVPICKLKNDNEWHHLGVRFGDSVYDEFCLEFKEGKLVRWDGRYELRKPIAKQTDRRS